MPLVIHKTTMLLLNCGKHGIRDLPIVGTRGLSIVQRVRVPSFEATKRKAYRCASSATMPNSKENKNGYPYNTERSWKGAFRSFLFSPLYISAWKYRPYFTFTLLCCCCRNVMCLALARYKADATIFITAHQTWLWQVYRITLNYFAIVQALNNNSAQQLHLHQTAAPREENKNSLI